MTLREYPTVRVTVPALERRLLTDDGTVLHATYAPGPGGPVAVVLVHGFNVSSAAAPNMVIQRILNEEFPVVALDLRGHGRSDGVSTLGDREIHDVAAAVTWARVLGHPRVVTVGFSLGGAVVLRHAGLVGGVAGVVAVSPPAFWAYRGTAIMRLLHLGIENPLGRAYLRTANRTRVTPPPWPLPWPEHPARTAGRIPPTPFLVVHGRQDGFFPLEHPQALARGAAEGAAVRGVVDNTEVWIEDFGHAEAAIPPDLVRRISSWARRWTAPPSTSTGLHSTR